MGGVRRLLVLGQHASGRSRVARISRLASRGAPCPCRRPPPLPQGSTTEPRHLPWRQLPLLRPLPWHPQRRPSSSSSEFNPTTTATAQEERVKEEEQDLTKPPEEPGAGECCGSDCRNCVYIEYWEKLQAYNAYQEQLKEKKNGRDGAETGQQQEQQQPPPLMP